MPPFCGTLWYWRTQKQNHSTSHRLFRFHCIYQITFANHRDFQSPKDKQNSRTTFLAHVCLEETQSNILDGLLTFWKSIGFVHKRVGSRWWPLSNILDRYYKKLNPYCLIFVFIKTLEICTFSWLIDTVFCVDK